MPKKLNGEQLPLLMPVLDRPRDEWIDMHCPLLSGYHLGDRVENEQHLQGTVTRHPDAAGQLCASITWDLGVIQYLSRSLVPRLQPTDNRGDRHHCDH